MHDLEELRSKILNKIKSKFDIKQLDINFKEEFYYPKSIHLLKFNIEQYEIKNLGNLAILKGKGLGIMKMLTVVFTPSITKDIPLVIIDFIKMANKRTVFIEFYTNHIIQKDSINGLENRLEKLNIKYEYIENYIERINWYTTLRNKYSALKKSTKKYDKILYEMVLENLEEYLSYVQNIKIESKEKNTKLETFINDLIYKGNPSTSVLEKALGKEETIKLFKEIIFNYK